LTVLARCVPGWPACWTPIPRRPARTQRWAAGGASRSSPKEGGDGDGGLPMLRLSLRPATMPLLRLSVTR
jgi:hypothetical protein